MASPVDVDGLPNHVKYCVSVLSLQWENIRTSPVGIPYRESHWFDIRRYKNHGFGDSRPTISTPACFFFIFLFDKPNFVKLGPSLSSLTDFNRV